MAEKKTVVQLYFNLSDPVQRQAAKILSQRTMKSAYVADAVVSYEAMGDKAFLEAAAKFRAAILKEKE